MTKGVNFTPVNLRRFRRKHTVIATEQSPPGPPLFGTAMHSVDIFPWDDNFNTGITKVDEQHRKLVTLLNSLASHVAFHDSKVELGAVFDELAEYTVYHFETEEAIWRESLAGDSSLVSHEDTHRQFVDTVLRLKQGLLNKDQGEVAEEALAFLTRWLASHILESDRYMAYLVAALGQGLHLDAAKQEATQRMSGTTRTLIDIVLAIYGTLSANTLQLMRELAERRRKEEALAKATLQAQAANIAKSSFLSAMSHEIRTPLNGILGMAQLLLQPGVSEGERVCYAQLIVDSGHQLNNLLGNIIDLSGAEAGNLEMNLQPFAPAELMRQIQADYQELLTDKGLDFTATLDSALRPEYVGDQSRLAQMLSHLMSNAVKFTRQGHIDLSVREVPCSGDMAVLEFALSDTGEGLPADKLEQIFQPFFLGDDSNTRHHGGAGLGLSLVRGLALAMGGDVGASSEVGKGSRFWFRVRVGLVMVPA